LEDFDFFPNAFSIASIVVPCSEVFIFVLFFVAPFTCDPCFHSNLDVNAYAYVLLIKVNMPFRCEIVERTNYEFHVKELISKFDFLRLMIKSWKMLTREVEE
jgi:hypothetical protein